MARLRRHVTVRRLVLLILLVAAAVALLPRIALTPYAFPSADDYCIVAETRDDGFWWMQVHSYLTWTGRYSAVLIESIFSQFDVISVYPWIALSTLLLQLVAIRMLVATMAGKNTSTLQVTAIAMFVAAVFIGGLPSIVEAFYWMPGVASYQWGILNYLVWISLLIRRGSREESGDHRVWHDAAIVVLTIFLPGYNEVSAPIVFATIGAFILVDRSKRGHTDRFLVLLLGIIVLLTALCFAAPGNGNRSGGYPVLASRHNLPYAVIETARQTVRFILNFGSSAVLWVGAVAMWWWGARAFASRFNWLERPPHVAAVLLCLVCVLYLTLFPVYWEYGEMNYSGEGRTYNVSYVVLCAIVLTIAGAIVRALAGPLSGAKTTADVRRGWVELTVAGVLAGLLIASPSTRHTYESLKAAPAYLKEEQARARALRRAPSEGVVFVDRITVRPAGLFWGDLEPDESHWINVCYAKYYKLQSVRSRS